MTTRQYIGARYVPVFADPVEWDDTREYEHLVMVQHVGETYISQQAVPIGAQLPDTGHGEESNEYWVHMSNWNAQVESYRQEVLAYNGRISTLEDDLPIADFDSVNTVKAALTQNGNDISDLQDALPIADFDDVNTVKAALTTIENSLEDFCVWIGDSYSTNTYAHGSTNLPSIQVPKMLGCTVKNYSQDGAGFLRDVDKNFAKQAQTAAADTSFAHDQVKWCIIFGGQNDVYQFGVDPSYDEALLISRFNSCISTLKTAFPNARILVVGVNSPKTWRDPANGAMSFTGNSINETAIAEVYAELSSRNAVGFCNVSMANLLMDSHFDNDDGHPNDNGYKELTSAIMSGIYGTSQNINRRCPAKANFNSVDSAATFTMTLDDSTNADWNVTLSECEGTIVNGRYIGYVTLLCNSFKQNSYVHINFPSTLCAAPNMNYRPNAYIVDTRNDAGVSNWHMSLMPKLKNNRLVGFDLQTPNAQITPAYVNVVFDVPLV